MALILWTTACTSDRPAPVLSVSTAPSAAPPVMDLSEQVTALDKEAPPGSKLSSMLADVRHMLTAKSLEAQSNFNDAATSWRMALTTARGSFGREAMAGWVRARVKTVTEKPDAVTFARLLLSESQGGNTSGYMIERGYNSESGLATYLKKTIPDALSDGAERVDIPPPPEKEKIPADDPTLTKTSSRLCKGWRVPSFVNPYPDSWANWLASLSENESTYFRGLLFECEGLTEESLKAFHAVFPALRRKQTAGLAMEASVRLLRLYSSKGERQSVAEHYLTHVRLWDLPGLTPETSGMTKDDFITRRVNDHLAAGRNRALIGDYEQAKILINKALSLAQRPFSSRDAMSSNLATQLNDLRAEGYHILASRVAIEKQDFESAMSMNTLGQGIPGLKGEWRDRLRWSAGLYEYLAGHIESAQKKWEAMLLDTTDDTYKPRLYYWLARSYEALGHAGEARYHYKVLREDYPLSFYSIMAANNGATEQNPDTQSWRDLFRDTAGIKTRLQTQKHLDLSKARSHSELGPLLQRAEVLIAAGVYQYARMSVTDIEDVMTKTFAMRDAPDAFVYLSRLQYGAQQYIKAINLTGTLAAAVHQFWLKYPEQIIISFPRPYGDAYQKAASENQLSASMLYGITRQESGFRTDAKSPAGAIGLMQLMPATAARYSDFKDRPHADPSDLTSPMTNITLAGRYLSFLNEHFKGQGPAIYSAYNAGEFAVEQWLKRRAQADMVLWSELIPFMETKTYAQNVWRNTIVYQFLEDEPTFLVTAGIFPQYN